MHQACLALMPPPFPSLKTQPFLTHLNQRIQHTLAKGVGACLDENRVSKRVVYGTHSQNPHATKEPARLCFETNLSGNQPALGASCSL